MQLIPNLLSPPYSVLVIDNAPYHSKLLNSPPNSNQQKEKMLMWQKYKNIPCSEKVYKADLYELIIVMMVLL